MDPERLTAFGHRFLQDLGTALHLATVLVGDRLGLYAAMADGRPVTAEELAARTGTHPRYVGEWLAAQAAAGYVDHVEGAFRLPPEHAALLTGAGGASLIPGGFQLAASAVKDEPLITDAFRTGARVTWEEHHTDLFAGSDRLARARYAVPLTTTWLPALEGVAEQLDRGTTVVDIGCRRGAATLLMAAAHPRSTFVGVDPHGPSIEWARRTAEQAGLDGSARFEVGAGIPGSGHRLVTTFDRVHGMADPVAVAEQVLDALAPDGTWLVVEPRAGDRLEDNLTAVGTIFYGASTMICTPAGSGSTLGCQAGEARLRLVAEKAGFTRFRRVAETTLDAVYEIRR